MKNDTESKRKIFQLLMHKKLRLAYFNTIEFDIQQ